MTVTMLYFLMILSLGILAGTGTGLLIGFIARKQKREWALMEKKDRMTAILLIMSCSVIFTTVLAWYIFSSVAM